MNSFPLLPSCNSQLQKIWDSEGEVGPGEEKLAVLTAHDRPSWADTRNEFFSSGVNKESMATIESVSRGSCMCTMVVNNSGEGQHINHST